MAKECDHSSGHRQFYPDHQQQKNYGNNRSVNEQQRNEDHRKAHQRDCDDGLSPLWLISATIAAGPVTYALTPGVRWRPLDDALDGFDRFVPQGRALAYRQDSIAHMRPCHRCFARRPL